MEEPGTKSYDESSDDYHQGPYRDFGGGGGGGGGLATLRASSHEWEDRHRLYHASHDSDTRSQCSQRSGYSSAGGGADHPLSSIRSVGSVGSQGSAGGLPLHVGHVHFGHALSAAHLLSGDATHQFPPSMYQASVDAPKSDAATVCSGSVLEDIEVESHVSEETDPRGSSKYHPSPPSSVKMASLPGLRRSNSDEGNRLVDFADRSQEALAAVFPQNGRHGSHAASSTVESMSTGTGTSGTGILDDDADMASIHNSTSRIMAGMGPPLSRSWLLQHHGTSPSRPGSVKSFESNTGSDVVAHVGSDCGGSLTDAQSVLSQEDALMAAASESGDAAAVSEAAGCDVDGGEGDAINNTDVDSIQRPHPLLCSQPDNMNGRISPGGTIYRGRGVRRYKGRFMHLPLKRFHHNGVHLSSVGEHGSDDNDVGHAVAGYDDRWQDRGYSALEDDYQRGDHNYYGHARRRNHSRSRSRSRSRSPSPRACAGSDRKNGYHQASDSRHGRYNLKAGRGYTIEPLPNGRNGIIQPKQAPPPSSSSPTLESTADPTETKEIIERRS
jgi:hypothetical protein